tara:strand:- start:309 stop:899 length:591 start_codon:yes stop_codon:yes gene_type:complete
MKRKLIITTIVFIVLYAIFGGDSNDQKKPTLVFEIEEKQKEFVTLIDSMRTLYLGEENQLKLTNIRKQRKEELKKLFKNRNVSNWKGKITSLTTGSDQKAYVEIKLYGSRNITIENNSLLGEGIAGNTETYNNLAELKVGDFVNFSGRFMYDSLENKDYLDEWSSTEYGSMEEPEFRFIFKSINKYSPIEKSDDSD